MEATRKALSAAMLRSLPFLGSPVAFSVSSSMLVLVAMLVAVIGLSRQLSEIAEGGPLELPFRSLLFVTSAKMIPAPAMNRRWGRCRAAARHQSVHRSAHQVRCYRSGIRESRSSYPERGGTRYPGSPCCS